MSHPPPYDDDLPTYDAGVYSGYSKSKLEGISLAKIANEQDLDFEDTKNNRQTVGPPPAESSKPREQQYNNQTVVVNTNGGMGITTLFHIISIICALCSLLVFPLLEIIPMVMLCLMKRDLQTNSDPNALFLHQVDFIVTLLVAIILFIIIIFIAVFSFGLGLIFLVLLIPFFFVLLWLEEIRPANGGRGLY